MANLSEMFPSKYLSEPDLKGQPRIVIMRGIAYEDVGQMRDRKPVLYFQGKNKGLVLNKTNATKIAKTYGDDSDLWVGHQIELYPSETDFQGETVPCIRVRAPQNTPGVQQAAAQAQAPLSAPQPAPEPAPTQQGQRLQSMPAQDSDLDDDIPW